MTLLGVRDLLNPVAFPPGDRGNDTDTIIQGLHFNTTALNYWNYTYYPENRTLSNDSKCYLIFDQYRPSLLANGTWINGTSCYTPIERIGERGATGVAFASLFAISIMFTLVNLRKHGQLLIREDKRFRVVGRRWQWYWMAFAAACGIVSTVCGIDVDRDYLQDIAIILQSFFFCLMTPAILAAVWEATRHWGSWQERQIVDADQFAYRHDDRRAKTEFWLPLVFYLFAWLNFFMVLPRSWTPIKKQRSLQQQEAIARPAGTDARFKAGAVLAVVAMAVICVSLHHSLRVYKPRGRGLVGAFNAFCVHCPTKLFLAIILLGVKVAYGILMAWKWDVSIFKHDCEPGWPYGLGYAPVVLIIVVLNIAGYVEDNEDRRILAQRRARGVLQDRDLGLTKKPHWWQLGRTELHMTSEQRLRALAHEVNTGDRRAERAEGVDMELGSMGGLRDRSRSRPPEDPFRDDVVGSPLAERPTPTGQGRAAAGLEVQRRESDNASTMTGRTDATGATGLTGRTLAEGQPQRVRSMLDV